MPAADSVLNANPMSDDKLLFHYTTAEGLLGLLGSPASPAKLWMTQIHYMNDHAEARHAYRVVANMLRAIEGQCPNLKRAAAGILGVPHEGEAWRDPEDFAVARDCIFSLTEQGDLLSQWRGYAPLGGYSIGYRLTDLNALALAQGLRLVRCIYDEAEQQELVRSNLLAIEAGFERGEIEGDLAGVAEHDRVRATASVRFQNLGHMLAPVFKHPSFREESEWRLVGNIGVNDHRARWRTRHSLVMPYAELSIAIDSSSPLLPVQIIVGPTVDYELARNSILYLTFNHQAKPRISRSGSTLR